MNEKHKLNVFQLKGILSVALLVISLIMFLFMHFLCYVDNSIDFKAPINGISYLTTAFNKGSYYDSNEYGRIFLSYNGLFSFFAFFIVICLVALIGIDIYYYFIKNKENRWIGLVNFAISLLIIIFYLIFILSDNILVTSIEEEIVPLYKCYEIEPIVLILSVLFFLNGVVCFYLKQDNFITIKQNLYLYFFLLIPLTYILVFCIYPIFLQFVLSFKNYKMEDGIFQSDWVGFMNFQTIFTDSSIVKMVLNTVFISVCRIVLGIIPPLILAILLFDMGMPKYRKVIQTIIYIPHFFSWIIIFAIAYAFVNQEGVINNVIVALGGTRITFFNNDAILYPLLYITDLWKELGWGTIIFMAALSGIDPTLYEAASIDGAGAMKKLFKITIPSIAPTIVFVSIMAIGNILKGAGGEQILLFGTDSMEAAQTIDTWVIWQGIGELKYGLASAVSFIQSLIGLLLVLFANKLSKKYTNLGLW